MEEYKNKKRRENHKRNLLKQKDFTERKCFSFCNLHAERTRKE